MVQSRLVIPFFASTKSQEFISDIARGGGGGEERKRYVFKKKIFQYDELSEIFEDDILRYISVTPGHYPRPIGGLLEGS